MQTAAALPALPQLRRARLRSLAAAPGNSNLTGGRHLVFAGLHPTDRQTDRQTLRIGMQSMAEMASNYKVVSKIADDNFGPPTG